MWEPLNMMNTEYRYSHMDVDIGLQSYMYVYYKWEECSFVRRPTQFFSDLFNRILNYSFPLHP